MVVSDDRIIRGYDFTKIFRHRGVEGPDGDTIGKSGILISLTDPNFTIDVPHCQGGSI